MILKCNSLDIVSYFVLKCFMDYIHWADVFILQFYLLCIPIYWFVLGWAYIWLQIMVWLYVSASLFHSIPTSCFKLCSWLIEEWVEFHKLLVAMVWLCHRGWLAVSFRYAFLLYSRFLPFVYKAVSLPWQGIPIVHWTGWWQLIKSKPV